MSKLMAFLFLIPVSMLAMQGDDDDPVIQICALGDPKKNIVARLPQRIGLECETIKSSYAFEDPERDYAPLVLRPYTFSVDPQFGSQELWKKLKPCLECAIDCSPSDVQRAFKLILITKDELADVLAAATYLGQEKLFKYCVAEWVDRDYDSGDSRHLPQEIEGAIANALLAKHELHHKIISIAAEKISVPKKVFKCKKASPVWTCAIGSDGTAVAAGCLDGSIQYWLKRGNKWQHNVIIGAHSREDGDRAVGRVQFIENDTRLISSGYESGVKVWDLQTRASLKSFGDAECNGFFFAYDEARGLLAIATMQHGINIYNLRADDVPLARHLDGHNDSIYALDFSPSNDLLVSAGSDKKLIVWNFITGELAHSFDLESEAFSSTFNQNGNFIAVGMMHGGLQIYDVKNHRLVSERRDAHEHGSRIWACRFLEEDTLLVTGAVDRKIKVWALPGLECLKVIEEEDWGQIFFLDQQRRSSQFLAAFSNGKIGLVNLMPLIKEIRDQRALLKNGLKIARARFWVEASQATANNPLICTGSNGKIFRSFSAVAQAQLIRHFKLFVPDQPANDSKRKKSGSKRKSAPKSKK